MKRLLESMREKPAHVRERFAFGVAAGITSLIGLVWFTTFTTGLFASFRETTDTYAASTIGEDMLRFEEGLSGIQNNLAGVGDAVQGLPTEERTLRSEERERAVGELRVEVVDKGGLSEEGPAAPTSFTF